ncbi:hypothetical protein MP638_000721 [Amoeboaphelidium occidentale]|nr:hypothetical protein MP638_000721 [Amoeboaphelidium occidentale]
MEFELSNGVKIPAVGLGTYRLRDDTCKSVVKEALSLGYKLIDTASVYKNEQDIGAVLKDYNNDRIFITTKLSPRDQGTEKCKRAIALSMEKLGKEVIDCYLMHWPGSGGIPPEDPRNKQYRHESWAVMEQHYKSGSFRSIGVSNFTVEHLRQLQESCDIRPHMLQTEFHPLCFDEELYEYCRCERIFLQAYSSFGEGELLRNVPSWLQELSKENEMTPAQVLLKWALDLGVGVIPKASNRDRLQENHEVQTIKECTDITGKLKPHCGKIKKFCWDPNRVA